MATSHETHYVNAFKSNYMHLPQQFDSKLVAAVTNELWGQAEYYYFDQYGTIDQTTVNSRTQATAENTLNVFRRRISLVEQHSTRYISRVEDIRLLEDPTNPILKSMKAQERRDVDAKIIAAFDATAYTGKTGSDSTNYDSAMTISGTGSDAMTLAKVKAAAQKLDEKEAYEDGRYLVMAPDQAFALMDDAKAANFDYISDKGSAPVQTGKLPKLFGFNIITSNKLGTTGGGRRKCFYWQREGLIFVAGKDRLAKEVTLSRRDDLLGNKQITMYWHAGASRVVEDLVGYIECTES